ncbi:EamA family transporter [Arcobacter sp.]|uniref:EamA family transporter n=1 Tax=unclassified Arcobacter TaxID=2593671 RepID=UPI003AFFCA05
MLEIKKIELITFGIFLQSFSFLSIKYASTYEAYSLVLLGIAFIFIVSRAYIWQIVLKHNELSRVYPFNSLVQVLIFVYAVIFFEESVNLWHVLGLGLMMIGLYIIGKTK